MSKIEPTISFIDTLPDVVYDVIITSFNDLITKHYSEPDSRSHIPLNDVVNMAKSYMPSRKDWDMKWFNMEDEYRRKGWKVKYHRPEQDESYEAFVIFFKDFYADI